MTPFDQSDFLWVNFLKDYVVGTRGISKKKLPSGSHFGRNLRHFFPRKLPIRLHKFSLFSDVLIYYYEGTYVNFSVFLESNQRD